MRTDSSIAGYRFGRFELQPSERRLLADGHVVLLGPRAFDLLTVLVRNSGHLITKDELLETIWAGNVVEENSLQVQVSSLRRLIGRESIATVSGRGYRFTLAVSSSVVPGAVADASPAPHNLPEPLTSFIGREKELVELSQLMRQTRLLTLTGAGGCGKTRLALQLAMGMRSMFPAGVWLVEFAALASPALVPQALAGALGLLESSAAPVVNRIADHLSDRRALLVLDNAEHLLDACAALTEEILKRCARTSVLVTSREHLGVTSEITFRVPSLSVPDRGSDSSLAKVLQFEAVRLFVERARMQRPHFAATDQNAGALASLSRQLDGIPLAIELAAARSQVLSPEEIDQRLDQRFALLTDGSRTSLPRHRTLQSLIDWSHDLLDEREKALLRRSAVFAGGWTLDAAEQVCAVDADERSTVLDRLASLVDKSLVQAEEEGGLTRYRLLETMRQYGWDRLRDNTEETRARDRHLAHFVALAEEAAPHLKSVTPRDWLARLDAEHDNLGAAMAWAAHGGHTADGMRLACGIWRFWWLRGHIGEGRGLLSPLLGSTVVQVDSALRAAALAVAGTLAYFQGDHVAARAAQEEVLAVHQQVGDRALLAGALSSLGTTLEAQGELERARALQEQSLAVYRELGATREIAGLLSNLGYAARNSGELARAQVLLDESLAIRRELADTWGIATSLLNLTGVARDRCDFAAAKALGEESLAIYRALGERRGVAYALGESANVACSMGELSAARAGMKESLAILIDLDDRSAACSALDGLAATYVTEQPERAARICGGADRLRQQIGFPRPADGQRRHDGHVATARAALKDDTTFDRALRDGAARSLAEICEYACNDADTGPDRSVGLG